MAVTFLLGLLLHGSLPRPVAGEPLSWLGTAAMASTGVLGVAAWALGAGRVAAPPTDEAGSAFLLTAGIMSLLLLLDTAERGRGTAP